MNKLTKLLSVFVIAGAIGTGVAGVAGCTTKDDGHKHSYEYTQIAGDAEKHNVHCTNDGHEGGDTQEAHTWSGDECSKCHYIKPGTSSELEVAADVTGILIEGVTSETITLSTTNKSHTIDKSAIKVYFATGNNADVKGTEVPAENLVLELKDSAGASVSSWENITKDGVYKVNASLQNAKMASGSLATIDDLKATVTVTISNPVKANSLTKTSTGDTTLEQGAADTVSANWTFEVELANGDKQPVAAADVKVSGIDTVTKGEKQATVTYGTQTIKVNYTVTAVEGMVTQSYAVNANTLALGSNVSNVVLNEAGKISLTAKSGKNVDVDANAKSIDGKSFVQRLKLGGSPIKNGALDGTTMFRTIKIEDVNKTTVEGAQSKTFITVYAASSSESTSRNLSIYKEGGTAEAPTLTKVENATCGFTTIAKYVYEITDKGTFHIASENGGLNIYYLQVDKIMTGETGAQEVPLGGELKAISLSLDTSAAKTVYKLNDTIDTSAITGTVTLANEVTADSQTQSVENANLTFDTSLFDNTTLGEYAITVTYGEGAAAVTKAYNVTVESEVDGVKGASATLKQGLNTEVETADAKLTLKSGDITVAPVWTSEAVTGVTASYIVKYNGIEIDAETGLEFAVGAHTLTVEITVTDGTHTANFTQEVKLTVTKKPVEGELTNVKMTVDAAMKEAVGTAATTEAKTLADGITLGLSNKAGSSAATIGGTSYSDYVQIAGSFKASDKDTKSIKLEIKGAATVKVICKSSAADRILNLYNAEGVKVGDGSDSTAGVELSFTVTEAGTFYLGSASSSINIYQIEIIYNA